MQKKILTTIIIMSCFLSSGCSINHFIAEDYPDYLQNNTGTISDMMLQRPATYTLSDRTLAHRHEFRSFMAGSANLWIVEFGKMFDSSLKSTDYSPSFKPGTASELKIKFDLERYEFKNFQTYITLNVDVVDGETNVFSKSYDVVGKNQASKVVFTGVFGMKNAVQQSTKLAIDELLIRFRKDLKDKNIAIIDFRPLLALN